MVTGMKNVIKNVEIRVEGALMRRWHKKAERVVDTDGNVMVWEPDLQRKV
jgi:hypothetical protein